MPLVDVAPAVLDRLHARVLKRGRDIVRHDAEARHALRLAVKKLRYAVDFLGDAAGDDPRRRDAFRRRLALLQQDLGEMNDRAAARELAAAVRAGTDDGEALAALATLGPRLDAADRAARPALLRDWRRFAARRPFWRAAETVGSASTPLLPPAERH
jgi:CHAD domain-containing protein